MRIGPLLLLACTALIVRRIAAQDIAVPGALQVPARTVPVPTDVSPELQRIIAAPRRPGWDKLSVDHGLPHYGGSALPDAP